MEPFAIVDSLDHKKWERFVCDHPKGSIFHTPEIYDVFRGTKYHSPVMLAALGAKGDVLALLLAVCVQTLPDPLGGMASRSILYAEPLCREDALGQRALAALLSEHDARVRNRSIFAEVRPLFEPGVEKSVLEQRGYEYRDYLNYLVRLRQGREELWKAMTSDCRRRIKKNPKRGLEVREVTTPEGVDILYRFLQLTFQRARVPLADKSLFAQALRVLEPNELIRISVAYYEGNPVGASVAFAYRDRVIAWYGGAERLSGVYPMEALNWDEIKWAQARGFAMYDFGGAGWPDQPYGVRNFKAKFGGDLVQYGRYRKVYSPWRLAAAERAYGLLRNVTNPTQWSRPVSGRERQD